MKFTSALIAAAAASQAQDIVTGFVKGALEVEIDGQCINDVEVVFNDATAVVQDFEEGTFNGVLDGVKQLIQTVSDVQSTIADCKNSKQMVQKLVEMEAALSSPSSFAYHVKKDLMINGKDILKEVKTAVTDYKSGDMYNFGVQIGEAAAKTLVGEEERIQDAEIMVGALNAYGGHFNLMALLACIQEEDKAALIVNAGIQTLRDALETKNYEELIGAAIAFFAAYQQAKQGLPACEAVDRTTFSKFNNDISVATSQINVLEAVADESVVQIVEDIIKAYESKNFVEVGKDLVELLQKIINKKEAVAAPEPKIARKDIASFVQGYFESTNVGQFNFTALLECIYVADQAAEIAVVLEQQIEEAYEDRQIQDLIPVAILGVALVQGVKQALPVCESVDTSSANWTTFDKIIETVESPVKFMEVVDHDIVANGKNITHEMARFLNAVNSADFYSAGLDFGFMMKDTCDVESSLFLF